VLPIASPLHADYIAAITPAMPYADDAMPLLTLPLTCFLLVAICHGAAADVYSCHADIFTLPPLFSIATLTPVFIFAFACADISQAPDTLMPPLSCRRRCCRVTMPD